MEGIENKDKVQENQYVTQKTLYKTKNGELCLVTKNANENEVYIMKHIEVRSNEEKTNILNELKKLSQINSKPVIKIKEFFIEHINEKEIISVILEFFDQNNSLYNIIYHSNFLISKNIWKIFIKLVSAIKSLHDQNIIVEDLNPQNIFLDTNNNIQIGGISEIYDLSNINSKQEEFDFSPYKCPEILKKENYDNKCNTWSLGCILYELAFKKLAFNNNENIINIKYELPEDADDDIKNILKKLLCDQKQRFNSKEIIFGLTFKKKLVEVNLFSEIISNDIKSFNYYFSTNIGIFDPKAAVDRFKLIELFEHPFYLICKKCNTPPEIILSDNENIIISCNICGIYENERIENIVNYSSKWVTNEIMAIPCSTKHSGNDSIFLEKKKKKDIIKSCKYCRTCNLFLCEECLKEHEKNGETTHEIIELKNLKHNCCNIHSEIIMSYCHNCQQNICYKCLPEHKSHYIEKIEIVNKSRVEDLKKFEKFIENTETIKNNKYIKLNQNILWLQNFSQRDKESKEELNNTLSKLLKIFYDDLKKEINLVEFAKILFSSNQLLEEKKNNDNIIKVYNKLLEVINKCFDTGKVEQFNDILSKEKYKYIIICNKLTEEETVQLNQKIEKVFEKKIKNYLILIKPKIL